MDIAVLSGKGGTGKTTISVNLAQIDSVILLDCDVEEPNSHLFIVPNQVKSSAVFTGFPVIDEDRCIHCGKCGDFCRFNAILCTKRGNIIMKELCHDCGGCSIVCQAEAITYSKRRVGQVHSGKFSNGNIHWGELDSGEFATGHVIRETLERGRNSDLIRIIDAPPGTACAAVESVEDVDYALIVTEPTPFGLSDMKMVVEMLRKMKIPFGVFINKSHKNGDYLIENYCQNKNIELLGRLPYSREYGESYAKGELISNKFPEVKSIFNNLWRILCNHVK